MHWTSIQCIINSVLYYSIARYITSDRTTVKVPYVISYGIIVYYSILFTIY